MYYSYNNVHIHLYLVCTTNYTVITQYMTFKHKTLAIIKSENFVLFLRIPWSGFLLKKLFLLSLATIKIYNQFFVLTFNSNLMISRILTASK